MASRKKIWLAQHAAGEKELAKLFRRFLRDQNKRIIEGVRASVSVSTIEPAKLLNEETETDELLALIEETMLGMALTGAYNVWSEQPEAPGADKAFKLKDIVVKVLPKRVVDAVSNKWRQITKLDYWRGITRGSVEEVTAIIDDAIKEDYSERKLTQRLQKELPELSRARAQAIARTETTMAYNTGHQASYEQLANDGVLELVEWLSLRDERVRDSHAAANGQKVKVGEKFKVGGSECEYPGDPSLPARERINCRCTTAAVFEIADEKPEPKEGQQ